ncbi:MAG TPA: PDGLE domain-containing protein [Dehalococcoidia bacterium]|jgi:hypothetical protein|nr:PDGLE domain-containing protein [Dehalococcoidia bacterium]
MKKRWLTVIVVGLAAALVVALFSPLASSHPDGLERVAEDEAFIDKAEDPSYEILPDYSIPGIDNEEVTTILSGIIGIAIVAAVGFGLAFAMKALSKSSSGTSSPPRSS